MDERYSGWTGLAGFAGILLLVAGIFGIVQGLVALFNSSYYLVSETGLLVFNYTTWGWIHIGLGALAMLAGVGIIAGETWALVVGIIIAAVHAIVQMGFLSAYPVWSTMIIALDVLIIYALATHGGYLAEDTAVTTAPQDIGTGERPRRVS